MDSSSKDIFRKYNKIVKVFSVVGHWGQKKWTIEKEETWTTECIGGIDWPNILSQKNLHWWGPDDRRTLRCICHVTARFCPMKVGISKATIYGNGSLWILINFINETSGDATSEFLNESSKHGVCSVLHGSGSVAGTLCYFHLLSAPVNLIRGYLVSGCFNGKLIIYG